MNTSYSSDGLSHLLIVLHQTGTTTLDGASYTYDPDPLYQLTQVTQRTSTTESYSYDVVGNRTSTMRQKTMSIPQARTETTKTVLTTR